MMELTPGDLLTVASMGGGKGGGTSDYASLRHKPTINGVTVTGDLSGADLSLATLDSSGRVPAEQLPSATAAPLMDGTADAGSAEAFAREDHVHPTDTSRASTAVATSSASGLMTGADKAKLDGISLPPGGVSMPETLTGNPIAAFDSTAAGRPLRVTVNIEPVQAAGTPSPSNPLPITGWTGANVTRTGKNLCPQRNVSVSTTARFVVIPLHHTFPAGTYTISALISSTTENERPCSFALSFSNAYIESGSGTITRGERAGKTATASIPFDRLLLYSRDNYGTSANNDALWSDIQLEAGNAASAFEPFGITHAFSFPSSIGTVYGGTLDVARGLLTVTHETIVFTSNSIVYTNPTTGELNCMAAVSDVASGWNNDVNTLCSICEKTGTVRFALTTIYAYIYNLASISGVSDTDTAKAWLDENRPQIVYPLAAPVTYQLTPQQLVTLDGTNNVFADCGPVTVTHWPGAGTPVEPVEDGAEIAWKKGILDRIAALEGGS